MDGGRPQQGAPLCCGRRQAGGELGSSSLAGMVLPAGLGGRREHGGGGSGGGLGDLLGGYCDKLDGDTEAQTGATAEPAGGTARV